MMRLMLFGKYLFLSISRNRVIVRRNKDDGTPVYSWRRRKRETVVNGRNGVEAMPGSLL